LGDVSNAIAAFTKAIELKPNFIFSYLERAKAFASLGNNGSAKRRDFERALALDPTNQEANEGIAALGNTSPPVVRNEPQARPAPQNEETSLGTGFFVSMSGHVLTNQHVVEGCRSATISRPGYPSSGARIVASDNTNDLALLKTDMGTKMVPAFKIGARIGEGVFAYGFPLAGLLSSSGNFTVGTIASVAGLDDDSRVMQISAPVQPGNSGGPLVGQVWECCRRRCFETTADSGQIDT
jgi:S1-C subfamily serine protease